MSVAEAVPSPAGDRHTSPDAVARLRRARLADRVSARVIRIGGVAVLVAVVAIFAFVGAEAVPLLSGADLTPGPTFAAPGDVRAVGCDEYRSHVSVVLANGDLAVIDAASGAEVRRDALLAGATRAVACVDVHPGMQLYVAGSEDGRIAAALVSARTSFDAARKRSIAPEVETFEPLTAREDGGAIDRIAAALFEGEKAFVAVSGPGYAGIVRTKLGSPRANVTPLDLRAAGGGTAEIRSLAVALQTDEFRVYAGLSDGRVIRWDAGWTDDPRLHESIEAARSPVTALGVVLGGETLVTGTEDGRVESWFGVRATTNASNWDLTRVRTFDDLGGAVALIAPGARRKGVAALRADGGGRIDYVTSGSTRAEIPPGGAAPVAASFAPKNDALLVADGARRIRTFDYADPHPEAGIGALFGKLWYEGGTEPEHKWQSTGGTDDFEPKLSVTTLVFGTLKGVLYALAFSVPVALLAAIYTALFLPARVKAWVKPTLEVMAALPSVVVGLLAALWLSPMIERNLPETFAGLPAFVVSFAVLVLVWAVLPRHVRTLMTQNVGVLGLAALTVAASVGLAAAAGPWLESTVFGGDLKEWLDDTLGLHYDARNATVVGFAMGFAVIPVIFTIAEDAISNVPKSLWAASEALGASRWQTTLRVVLPAATPGIFAALMLGFGRAIGETMIVLMATGNTPILDLSPFNGMRTISACVAVEIPEAPHGGTLYRVLFLAGALLFLFTFVCNTVAEVVGSRLRKRYGRAG